MGEQICDFVSIMWTAIWLAENSNG